MRKFLLASGLCILLGAAALPLTGQVAPRDDPTPWQVTFRFQDPQRVSVFMPGRTEPIVYWHVLYTVENNTKSEIDFYPEFELVTDTLRKVRSERKVSPEAFKAVQRRAGDPLLLTPEKMVGRLLRGRERARHGVALFRDFDPKAKAFTLYVSGLSGRWGKIKNPAFDAKQPESKKNPRYFVLRETLAVPYKFPGSESLRSHAVPQRVVKDQRWIKPWKLEDKDEDRKPPASQPSGPNVASSNIGELRIEN